MEPPVFAGCRDGNTNGVGLVVYEISLGVGPGGVQGPLNQGTREGVGQVEWDVKKRGMKWEEEGV